MSGAFSTGRLFGPAVCANGFTADAGDGAYWIDGAMGADTDGTAGDMPVDAAGDGAGARRSPAGAPHAVQNFRVPMSSAPHFAQ